MAQELIEQDPVLDVNEAKAIIRDGFSLWYQLWSDSNQLTGLILHENDNINADSHVDYITEAFLRQKLAMGGELTANSVRAMLTPTLFAGCGSTGFAAYNGVSRNLASLPIVSDLDHIAPHNIPRQANSSSDVGEHKAHLAAGNIHDLLPHTPILVDHDGISNDTIDAQLGLMVNFSEQMSLILERHGISGIQPIIFDSVDVTGKSGWEAKFELHRSAYEHRIPVVGAYDIGTRSQGFYFPYHIPNEPLLHGKINSRDVANLNVQQLNMLLLPKLVGPIPDVPTDYARQYFARADQIVLQMEALERGEITKDEVVIPGIPQERIASSYYEGAAAEIMWKIIDGRGNEIPRLFKVESRPESLAQKLKLCLLFATHSALIKRTADFEQMINATR